MKHVLFIPPFYPHSTGFSLGSTMQSHTKGIWMWCVPHPQKPGHTLVLLDTEGLEDIEKVQHKLSDSTHVVSLAHLVFFTPNLSFMFLVNLI